MKNWREIDGFINEEQADILAKFIQLVPENGWIIEIGCFKGKQSSFIASTKKDSIMLSCIDPFPVNLINLDDSKTYRHYTFDDWVKSTSGYLNIEAVKTLSPFNISNIQFSKIPDLIIYNMDLVYDSLVFWNAHIGNETKILVHTYKHEHSRIVEQIEKFTSEYDCSCSYVGGCAVLGKGVKILTGDHP